MYCFARFCCLCLSKENNQVFYSVKDKCRDNMSILDKITLFVEEVIQNKMPDPLICKFCRDNIIRTYRFILKSRTAFQILSGYADKLKEKCKDSSSLEVHMNTPTSINKRKKPHICLESDDKGEIYETCLPLTNIENSMTNPVIEDSGDVKPALDLSISYSEDFQIKQEVTHDNESTEEHSLQTESMDNYEEFFLKSEITVKDEFCVSENKSSYLVDVKNILNTPEDDFNIDSLPLSEEKINVSLVKTPKETPPIRKITTPQDIRKPKKRIPFPCPFCKNSFYSASVMARHLSKQHNRNRFNCNKCDFSFKSENVLKRHSSTHSYDIYCKI